MTCTGLQPGSNVYVFGPEFQLSDDGCVIPVEDQRYIWIETVLQKLQQPVNPLPPLPNYSLNHLNTLVNAMQEIAGENVQSGVYLLGIFMGIHSY